MTDPSPRLGVLEASLIVVWLSVLVALAAVAAGVIAFAVRLGWGN